MATVSNLPLAEPEEDVTKVLGGISVKAEEFGRRYPDARSLVVALLRGVEDTLDELNGDDPNESDNAS